MVSGLPAGTWGFVAAVFVLAGLVKGVVGLGLPTISMALLALFMPPAQAAALLIVPSFLTNVWQARPFHTLGPLLRRIGGMQIGVCVGTLGGAWLLGAPSGHLASAALGVALVAYALWGLFGQPLAIDPAAEGWAGLLVGAVTGVVTAATGVFAVPAVPYLQALGLGRDGLIQAMGVSFTVSTVALAGGLWLAGGYAPGAAGASLLMLLPALAGMWAGTRLRRGLPPRTFRLWFMYSLILLGLYQIVQAILSSR
ncbi:membrane protein [Bordetella ansorpii]|uniref:Probable membrane transporter protein n=2 Tax=Bordetella ansorpii TaxID=288768 RepID=A0A157SIJ8_9BORD|nr:membrane protein [Bordetella ansorpii]